MARHPGVRSSLSLAEPTIRSLDGWVDSLVSRAIARARRGGAPVLCAETRKLEGGKPQDLPLNLLDSTADAFFFGDRDRTVIGAGVARAFQPGSSIAPGDRLRDLLSRANLISDDPSRVTIVGGWGFPLPSGSRGSDVWRDHVPSRWIIPAFALSLTKDAGVWLTMAVHARPSSNLATMRGTYRSLLHAFKPGTGDDGDGADVPLRSRAEAIDDHNDDDDDGRVHDRGGDDEGAAAALLPRLVRSNDVPSKEEWIALAQEALDSVSKGDLKKIVLSRAVSLTFSGRVHTSVVVKRLIALNPDAIVFAVKRKGSVFLGATPESLMSVEGEEIQVDCLAASSPRSKDEAEDDRLGARLLEDGKSRSEHQLVVQAAVSSLAPMSSSVEVPDGPVLRKLTTIHHLSTTVRARLLDGADAWTAALALWPNPAIAGEPWGKAVRWVQRHEKMGRGWYSGVVGLMTPQLDEARMVIGIRSAVVRGRRAVIYAGAGIVAGSDPAEEFEETGWKLRTMRRAFGIDADAAAPAAAPVVGGGAEPDPERPLEGSVHAFATSGVRATKADSPLSSEIRRAEDEDARGG
jgi:menaquinone-specific isochorismate synthase